MSEKITSPVPGLSTFRELEITNPSFEDRDSVGDGLGGDFGWTIGPDGGTNRLGAVMAATPDPAVTPIGGAHEGAYFMWGRGADGSNSPNPSRLFQRLDLSPYSTAIDAGSASVHFTSFGLGDDLNEDLVGDFAQMHIAFFDSTVGGTQLGDVSSNIGVAYATWTEMTIDSAVPAGTQSVEVSLSVARPSGGFSDAGFDDVKGSINLGGNEIPEHIL